MKTVVFYNDATSSMEIIRATMKEVLTVSLLAPGSTRGSLMKMRVLSGLFVHTPDRESPGLAGQK